MVANTFPKVKLMHPLGVPKVRFPCPPSFSRVLTAVTPEIMRIGLENAGYIGYIEIAQNTSLVECRQLISEHVEGAPHSFVYLLPGDVPIGPSQETQPAVAFLPALFLRVVQMSPSDTLPQRKRDVFFFIWY